MQDNRDFRFPWRGRLIEKQTPAPAAGGPPNLPPRRTWLTFGIILLANYVVMSILFPSPNAPITVPYTTFKEEAAKGNVKSIYSTGASIEGRFVKAVSWPPADATKAAPTKGAGT